MSNKQSPLSFADSPDFVVSLARGLDIIKAFGVSERSSDVLIEHETVGCSTLSEVAEKTGLARAVVRRFLYTLVELGYVITDGKYFRLTAKILSLGFAYLASFSASQNRRTVSRGSNVGNQRILLRFGP